MRVLVTGSKGIIGQKISGELKQRGHSVFGIDLLHHAGETGFMQEISHESWEYARCDIGEYRQIERIILEAGPFDLVYNCAAEFGRWNGEDYYEQMWKSNLIGLKNIIRLQEKYKFKLVHFSSSEIYGDFDGVMTENVPEKYVINQMNDYAISKWANELQIRNSRIMYGTETVIVRLFNTYGPGEYYHPYRSAICKFCYHALKGLPITVYKGHYRSNSYIDDCAKAITSITDNFIPGRIYNIGSDGYCNMRKIANIIWDYMGADRELIKMENKEEILTTKKKQIDIGLSIKELGYKSTVGLEEGIKRTIEWMKEYYKL